VEKKQAKIINDNKFQTYETKFNNFQVDFSNTKVNKNGTNIQPKKKQKQCTPQNTWNGSIHNKRFKSGKLKTEKFS
jgi:hypothetical protein